MKRHDALIPLTHDHHHALAQVRRLKESARSDDAERLAQASEFIDFFHSDATDHFREEEEIVFPLGIDDARAADLLTQAVVQHLQIHALVARMTAEAQDGQVAGETAVRVAEALERHIRLEEKQIFPMLEQIVSADRLSSISLASRTRFSAAGS